MQKNAPLRPVVYEATKFWRLNPYANIVRDGIEGGGQFEVQDLRLAGVLGTFYLVTVRSSQDRRTRLIRVYERDLESNECQALVAGAREASTRRSRFLNNLAYRWQNGIQIPSFGDVRNAALATGLACYIVLATAGAGMYGYATAQAKSTADINAYNARNPELQRILARRDLVTNVNNSISDGSISEADISRKQITGCHVEYPSIFSLD